MGHFSELRSAFKTFADISATQASLITELNTLKAKTSLTTTEQARYNEIITSLSQYIVSAEDINNIQTAIVNLETFLDNQPIYDRGAYNHTTTYNNGGVVYLNGSAFICKANNTVGVEPTENATKWKIFVKRGVAAKMTTSRATTRCTSQWSSVYIPISGYKYPDDCLLVYLNGQFLNEGTDYEINGTDDYFIESLTSDSWKGTDAKPLVFDFCVIKNVYDADLDIDGSLIINGGTSRN